MTRTAATLLVAATVAAVPATAVAQPDHRGAHKVCATSTWIERAPADHPIGIGYAGDVFHVTRAGYHTARGELWAKGKLVHRESKAHKTFTYRGWIRVAALRGC